MVDYQTMQRTIRQVEESSDAVERFCRRSLLPQRVDLPRLSDSAAEGGQERSPSERSVNHERRRWTDPLGRRKRNQPLVR